MSSFLTATRASSLVILAVAWVPTCNTAKTPVRHFDAPAGIAVAPYRPEGYSAARPPLLYGFVADPGFNAIRRINLTDRGLTEPRFPVGRALSAVVSHTGASGVVDAIWGLDRSAGRLVRVDPAKALTPTFTAPTSSPACCTLDGITVKVATTATETWTVTYRASLQHWDVVGSGSGVQSHFARTNAEYQADNEAVRFFLHANSAPSDGDSFVFSTDNGVTESAVVNTGNGLNLVKLDDNTALVSQDSPAQLIAFDLGSGAPLQYFGLPATASPGALEVSADSKAVYVSDLGNPVIYRLNTVGPVATWSLDTFPAPVPMRDLAATGDNGRLFAMAADADDVFVFETPDFIPVDFSALVPGFDPLRFPSTIRSLAAGRLVHGTHGSGTPTWPVLLTAHGGNAYVLLGGTGCIDFNDPVGARLTGLSFRDASLPSSPKFRSDLFEANRCGGVVHTETWSFIYDGLAKVWRAKGSFSGPQVGVLTEGVPYTTDRGEITLEIDGDAGLPTDDGDTFFLTVSDGVSLTNVQLVPGKPVFYQLPPDATGRVIERALIPNVASDSVSDVDLDNRRVVVTYR
ncbi:MAG TPA: hypothetical protein VMV18_00945 [bacterium]|nr:hypothetical protein [bacterium]